VWDISLCFFPTTLLLVSMEISHIAAGTTFIFIMNHNRLSSYPTEAAATLQCTACQVITEVHSPVLLPMCTNRKQECFLRRRSAFQRRWSVPQLWGSTGGRLSDVRWKQSSYQAASETNDWRILPELKKT